MLIEDKRAKDGMLNVLDPILKTIAADYVDEVSHPIVGQCDTMNLPSHLISHPLTVLDPFRRISTCAYTSSGETFSSSTMR